MSELKNKILILLIGILSVFLVTILLIFNISIYNKEFSDIKTKIKTVQNVNDSFNPMFMENGVYEVVLGRNHQVQKVISYSPNGLSKSEVMEIFYDNVGRINDGRIGSLYKNAYIFTMNRAGNLLVIDNSDVKSYLVTELVVSIIIFLILEAAIVAASMQITKWIVKPVEDNMAKQKQFIYDASHELKTPISIIGASVETLEKNPREKKWLSTIKDENERMGTLVSGLLDLSKSEDIREKEVYDECNLSKIIENKALSFESLIFENNLTLVTNIEPEILFCCNEDRIKELLSVLMDNAIKHSLDDSQITVVLRMDKRNIVLSVTNRGEEIPVAEREKIFERFYRIDKARNRDENRYGLGLSIAKNIVINHNGNISVDCKNGFTTFTVVF